jgi:hypothetical protein
MELKESSKEGDCKREGEFARKKLQAVPKEGFGFFFF